MKWTLLVSALLLGASAASAQTGFQPRQGEPLEGLTLQQVRLFDQGRDAFEHTLTVDEGLGPIMNEISCAVCHSSPRTGGFSTTRVTRFGRMAQGGLPFDPLGHLGGSLRQEQAIDPICLEVVPPEADVVAERLTPIVFGVGLIEAIPDADIIARANNQPPGLAGFVRMAQPLEDPMGPMRVAKFGWKSGVPTVMSFSIDASLNEMGLTSTFLPNENAPNGNQQLLNQCDTVPDPEDHPDAQGFTLIDRFTHFQRFSAPPPQTPRSGMSGEVIFDTIGCAGCHVPTWTTGNIGDPALSGIELHPYTDFLLHDMGTLGDGIVDGPATETLMATRTLWGLRSRSAFLHDGRAEGGGFDDDVRDAILAHDGEAAPAAAAFDALMQPDKDALFAFLGSLGRGEFDFEADDDVDFFDWFFIEPAYNGPVAAYTPDDPEAINDADQDGDFDLRDYAVLQRAWTGQLSAASTLDLVQSQVVTTLDVELTSEGASEVWVAPGASLDWVARGETSGPGHLGLAMFALDLDFDGGALSQGVAPAALASFVTPQGINDPAGFGGTSIGGDLVNVGGGQNTIANTFAPKPVGTVVEGVALHGAPAELVSGSLVAPTQPGTYRLRASNLSANVLARGTSAADPFRRVDIAAAGTLGELVVHVIDCGTANYCIAKTNSQGCTPAIAASGTPSLTGPDDFHVTASDAINSQFGLMVWGATWNQEPLLGGTLCVGLPFTRTAFQGSGGTAPPAVDCSGTFDFHFTQADLAAAGLTAGTAVYCQYWYRDPQHLDGTGAGLTDGLVFVVCP